MKTKFKAGDVVMVVKTDLLLDEDTLGFVYIVRRVLGRDEWGPELVDCGGGCQTLFWADEIELLERP